VQVPVAEDGHPQTVGGVVTTVEHLESVAQQLAARLREDEPEANLRWLRNELGLDPTVPVSDVERLCFALAAAYPIEQTWRQATAWVGGRESVKRSRLVDKLYQERYGPRPRRVA
jgi:hypothetical protein